MEPIYINVSLVADRDDSKSIFSNSIRELKAKEEAYKFAKDTLKLEYFEVEYIGFEKTIEIGSKAYSYHRVKICETSKQLSEK